MTPFPNTFASTCSDGKTFATNWINEKVWYYGSRITNRNKMYQVENTIWVFFLKQQCEFTVYILYKRSYSKRSTIL